MKSEIIHNNVIQDLSENHNAQQSSPAKRKIKLHGGDRKQIKGEGGRKDKDRQKD